MELRDKYFFDNDYFKIGAERVVEVTQKWNDLMKLVFTQIDVKKELVTEELLIKALEGELVYVAPPKPRQTTYKKIERPEGYMTVKERKAKKAADKAARKAREEKYGRNVYRKT